MTAVPTLPVGLVDSLATAGHHVAEVTRGVVGPLAARYGVRLTDGRHLWVDHVLDGAARLGGHVAAPSGRARQGAVVLADAVMAGDARVHETPWSAELLGDRLTSGGALALPPALGDGLGRLLHALHRTPAVPPPGGRSRPRALERVLAARHTVAGGDPTREGVIDRVLGSWSTGQQVLLHGEPATGHVLVPADPAPGVTPIAVLTGWSGGPTGPAWFDVGYLLGDLVEVAHVVAPPARQDVLALAAAVRRGYDPEARLTVEFWERARDAAVIKLLDHEARIASAFGVQEEVGTFLRLLTGALLDPRSAAGAVLAPTTTKGSS